MSSFDTVPERFLQWPSSFIEMSIDEVRNYPVLEACLQVWRDAAKDGLPPTLDPVDLPPQSLKGVSLLDWIDDKQDWVIRLSSTLLDEGHGRSMRGLGMRDGFRRGDDDVVRAKVNEIVARGEPNLMRREYMDPQGRVWSYVRLILPLSSDGVKRDRYAFVIDPVSFGKRIEHGTGDGPDLSRRTE